MVRTGTVFNNNADFKREEKVWLICLIVLIGFLVAVIFHYIRHFYSGRGFPQSTFLFNPNDHFRDFSNIMDAIIDGDPLASVLSCYFPFTYLLFKPFTSWRPAITYYFTGLLGYFYFVFFSWNAVSFIPKTRRILATLIVTVTSYPILFCLDRGNFDLFVFVFSLLFIQNWIKSNLKWSAVFLSMAISMKLYPGILGVLYIAKRQFKPAILTFCLALAETVISAATLPKGIIGSFKMLINNLHHFKEVYVLGEAGIQYCATYYGAYRVLSNYFFSRPLLDIEKSVTFFSILALILSGLLVTYLIFHERILWKQTTYLTFAAILLPHVSFEYKLIFVLIPTLLFMKSTEFSRYDPIYAGLFGLILIPKSYWFFWHNASLGTVVNPALMTCLILLAIYDRNQKMEIQTRKTSRKKSTQKKLPIKTKSYHRIKVG